MEVTFLVGNGFDIGLGLHTRYTQFFDRYVNIDSPDTNVMAFKELLKHDGPSYPDWSDFERALGQHTMDPPLNDIPSLRACLHDFQTEFAKYLKEQEGRIDYAASENSLSTSFAKDLLRHRTTLEREFRARVENALAPIDATKYNFINFNYTSVLDHILDAIKRRNDIMRRDSSHLDSIAQHIHIHGTTVEKMMMGVNGLDQLSNQKLFSNQRQQRLIIKPVLNRQTGRGEDQAAIACIQRSKEICILGMSMGITDNMWWEEIGKWLKNDKRHQLLIFSYQESVDLLHFDTVIDAKDAIEGLFLSRTKLSETEREEARDQIHVIINSGLFSTQPTWNDSDAKNVS